MIARRGLVSGSVGALLALSLPASAAPGDLDLAFSGDGRKCWFGAAAAGNKIVVAAGTAPATLVNDGFAVERLLGS